MKMSLLEPEVSARWKEIGLILGVGDDLSSLDQMITKWLSGSATSGPPTLRRLVGAIAIEKGGNNPDHAKTVIRMFYKGNLIIFCT